MTQVTEAQIKALENKIYDTLICGHDEEGNEFGMGEMGEVHDTAQEIVSEWVTENNIEIIEE